MNRILRIVLYAVIMFLVFLWVTSIYKSCQNTENAPQEELLEDQGISEDELLDDLFEDEENFEDVSNTNEEASDEAANQIFEDAEPIDQSSAAFEASVEESILESETPAEVPTEVESYQPPQQVTSRPSSQTSGGKHLVIAGSYLIKSNADSMVGKLMRMGFNNAEIVQFDLSQYHSICAGRYNSHSSAQSIVKQLKAQGIDSYVHVKN